MVSRGPTWIGPGGLERRTNRMHWRVQLSVAMAVDRGASRGGRDQPEQHPQRGRLAGAVGSEEPDYGAPLDREAHLIDCHDLAEALGQRVDLDRRGHGR